MKTLPFIIGAALVFNAINCATPKKKDDEGKQYFDSVLISPEVNSCHEMNHFFEFEKSNGRCSDIPLAKWPCSESGLLDVVKTTDLKKETAIQLNRIIRKDGYQMMQCGEKNTRAFITFSRRNSTKYEANLEFIRADFALGD